ncbi:LpxL/LpxP family acyltransferase [Leeia oryzae]|uniref:LpxL/LpxP family acyltransferase n=1 Tax=Leeia oryzae TaxID=356662 RepID=UPI000360CE72|nr:hypothetical protein [Leeia oryzae]
MTRPADDKADQKPAWMQQAERGSRFWLKVMCVLSNLFGRRLSRLVLYPIAAYFLLFGRKAGQASCLYLARVLGRKPTLRERYRHILTFATTIHDRLYLLQDRFDLFEISLAGADELHAHNQRGQGLLLLGAHLGSFEVLRAMARHKPDLQMRMAMYSENARQINQALGTINPAAVPDIIELGSLDAMLQVHHELKRGALVGILADRASGPDEYVALPFLGRTARFPTGPFRMAVMLAQPVYFMTGLHVGGNRYQVHFELLADFADGKPHDRQQAVQMLMTRYVEALAAHCRARPANWFNFYDFWEEL